MANDKNDISDIVKTCKILLLDIEGTTTSISFVKDKLFPYAEENIKSFLEDEWESENVKEAVAGLRKLALDDEDKKVEGVVAIPGEDASKEDQIEGIVKNVNWQMSLDRKVGPLKQLQGLVWSKGYEKGELKGHVYEDVSPALELWRSTGGQKVYIYSSGSVEAQKLLFGRSSAGDMLTLIDGHFDTAVGAKQEAASYTAIAENIGCKPEEILFLTDIDKEAEAARAAGLQVMLVIREGNAPLTETITASFPVLYSFGALTASKKRKPDDQDEQQPAKVLKTDIEADVKSSTETQVAASPQPETTPPVDKTEETEKMEIEDDAPATVETTNGLTKEVTKTIETVVEEVTDLNSVADIPVSDSKPIIVESTEKTDHKETESMETESAEINSVPGKQNGDKHPAPEETPPVVITEIKDITNDKEKLGEITEVIDDIVPVVEEPPAQDMEDLQNVGEVLEKECDEILSKVEDVTNLENIPTKPLQTIAEETMETDNENTSDIVEGILDQEQAIEKRQLESKTSTDEDKSKEQAVNNIPSDIKKTTENVLEKSKTEESKVTASSSVEEHLQENVTLKDEKVTENISTVEQIKLEESSPIEKEKEINVTEESTQEKRIEENEKISSQDKVNESNVTEEKEERIVEQKVPDQSSILEVKAEEKTVEEVISKKEESVDVQMETDESKKITEKTEENVDNENKAASEKLEVETSVDKPAESATNESVTEVNQVDAPIDKEETEQVSTESSTRVETETESKETPLPVRNAPNRIVEKVNVNGNMKNKAQLKYRAPDNEDEAVNGANGDSMATEARAETNGDDSTVNETNGDGNHVNETNGDVMPVVTEA